jgi:hypothetical protein
VRLWGRWSLFEFVELTLFFDRDVMDVERSAYGTGFGFGF